MSLEFNKSQEKPEVWHEIEEYIAGLELGVAEHDSERPWGGFFVIDNESTDKFIDEFFPDLDKEEIYKFGETISPKILLVAPNQKLSWQYHHRRAELWRAVKGPVGIMVSNTDTQPEQIDTLQTGDLVKHDKEVRHRLIGLNDWGVVAEIWQHTESGNPSDEDDIIRLEDDYGRN